MTPAEAPGRISGARRSLMALFLLALTALFLALGVWQVERRRWKLDLIAAVDQRAMGAPQPAPGPAAWSSFSPQGSVYTRLVVHGTLLHDHETLVQALTVLGPGYWVLTPLRTDDGWTVLVNRGFVPAERSAPASRAAALPDQPVEITGLLRVSEPGGGFLLRNDPAGNHWYSRDVEAISAARGLSAVAPYFIDADNTTNPGGYPVGGLTVITFPNSHLVYAITWFTLAGLGVAGLWTMRAMDRSRRRD